MNNKTIRMKCSRNFALSIIIGLAPIFLTSCGSSSDEAGTQSGQRPTRPAALVKTLEVGLHDLKETLELPGTLEPENIANVLSTTEGKITQMTVRQGDKVQEGDVLAMLSPLLREDIINAARLNLISIEQELDENPNNQTLFQQLQQAQSDYEFAIKQYRQIPIIAPVSGIISDRWVDMGDMVPARHKMFEIQSNSQLLVKVPVSELDIRKLTVGQTASIYSDACPERVFTGSIQRIYPQVDRETRNALVEVLLPAPCPQLRPGMFIRVSFVTRNVNNSVAIPASAILERGQRRVVLIVEEETAMQVDIETGIGSNGLIEIISGLQAGQQLVIEGQGQIQHGARVRIQQQKADDNKEGGNE